MRLAVEAAKMLIALDLHHTKKRLQEALARCKCLYRCCRHHELWHVCQPARNRQRRFLLPVGMQRQVLQSGWDGEEAPCEECLCSSGRIAGRHRVNAAAAPASM